MWHYRAPLFVIVLVHLSSCNFPTCLEPAAVLVTLHAPNNVPHRICRPYCSSLISFNTLNCLACRSPVELYEAPGIPPCSKCNLNRAVAHCFNPDCLSRPTLLCKPCSHTLYFLTHRICPFCAGPRPIPYVDPFVMNCIVNFIKLYSMNFIKVL